MALSSLFCADVPLSNYSLTHSLVVPHKILAWQLGQNRNQGRRLRIRYGCQTKNTPNISSRPCGPQHEDYATTVRPFGPRICTMRLGPAASPFPCSHLNP